MKDVAQAFDVGSHTVRIEFLGHESGGAWGYPSPKAAGGRARILLSYLVSRKALLDILKSDSAIDQKMLQRFMKDEGLDKGVKPDATVNKFVGRKDVQF
jgi:hypothetical protein